MRNLLFFLLLIPIISFSQQQEGFSGKLTYRITICDSSLAKYVPPKLMVIYTNDTLLRIENETDQLGRQVIIKHMVLNKSYLLLDLPVGSYAVQTDHTTEKQDTFPYRFKKRWGKREICGLKANRLKVSHGAFPEPLEFLYIKKFNTKYINTLENFPGLPVHYYIATVDGIYLYELISIENTIPEKDLFGIPSNYKRVTFDQFMDELFNKQEQPEGPQEK